MKDGGGVSGSWMDPMDSSPLTTWSLFKTLYNIHNREMHSSFGLAQCKFNSKFKCVLINVICYFGMQLLS